MKKFAILAACAALGACMDKGDPAPTETATMAAEATPAAMASPNVAMVGTYEFAAEDGSKVAETLSPDGTYVDMAGGKEVEAGTWRVDGDKSCFTPAGKDEYCVTATMPDAEGMFDVMDPDGKVTTKGVKKVS